MTHSDSTSCIKMIPNNITLSDLTFCNMTDKDWTLKMIISSIKTYNRLLYIQHHDTQRLDIQQQYDTQ